MLGKTILFPGDIGHEPQLTPRERQIPRCPICAAETWELVRDRWGDIVGCPDCVELLDASDGSEEALVYFMNGGM